MKEFFQARYHLLSPMSLSILLIAIAFGYGVAYQIYPAHWRFDVPVPMIKGLKFTAFILASYPLWNAIGRDEHRVRMLEQSVKPGLSTAEHQYALQQLIRLDSDERIGIRLGAVAFIVLALLACFGEV
ncbi:hypothetical protein [Pseudomonas sp. OA65]|uniref:hypothetical protein n=1 Tax=Pseudomonas sp. OA65 TaxID=2818431 RepID=UPI001A9FB2CE|nr:hypothetical protein [Pseudomonas sp. OA65]MBO1541248.1 hypothetical protein [Pseudomonas sp. OA65]